MSTRSVPHRGRHRGPKTTIANPVIHPHAAGIDIGAEQIYLAVPSDSDPEPVRAFGTFTDDLLAAVAWLRHCGVRTVAMEATGVYWIPLFQILEAQGFEVYLVNARHAKNVPGRPKTDMCDCQWLQYLHSVGLLSASFRPAQEICALRAVLRHRQSLLQSAGACVQQMQKALTQMNVQLHHVLSDVTGQSGLAILDAVLAGERHPEQLAALCDRRVKACRETVMKSLRGDWRPEHLFTLKQALASYRHYLTQMSECDAEVERLLAPVASATDPPASPPPPARGQRPKPGAKSVILPTHDLRTELHRTWGIDLTRVPGLDTTNSLTLLAELGPDLSSFPSAKHFCSWLGLCPDNRITGRKVKSTRTREVANRAAQTLRMAVLSLWRSDNPIGRFYQRMRAKLGAPKAITAAAHKLARILYTLVTTRTEYDESVFARAEEEERKRHQERVRRQAAKMGFDLVPKPVVS